MCTIHTAREIQQDYGVAHRTCLIVCTCPGTRHFSDISTFAGVRVAARRAHARSSSWYTPCVRPRDFMILCRSLTHDYFQRKENTKKTKQNEKKKKWKMRQTHNRTNHHRDSSPRAGFFSLAHVSAVTLAVASANEQTREGDSPVKSAASCHFFISAFLTPGRNNLRSAEFSFCMGNGGEPFYGRLSL